jgi:hypothetical protein
MRKTEVMPNTGRLDNTNNQTGRKSLTLFQNNNSQLTSETQKFDVFNKNYHLYLKIYYKCPANTSIAISGSIEGVGNWKDFTELIWTAGDIWVTKDPIFSQVHFFRYKYVLFNKNEKKLISWERGVDRIADMEILEPLDRVPNTNRIVQRELGGKPLSTVEIDDEWEEFTVVFSVSHPSTDGNDQMVLDGNIKEIDYLSMQRV